MEISTDYLKRMCWNIEQLAKEVDKGTVNQEVLLRNLSNFMVSHGYIRSPYELNFSRVERARALPVKIDTLEKAEKEFGNISSMSYVPEEFLKYVVAGRCNFAKEAVFYCSNENVVPIFEVRPELGSYVVVTAYRHKVNKKIQIHVPIIGIKQIIEKLELRDQTDNLLPIIKDDPLLKKNNPISVLIDDLFSNWFTSPSQQHIYRLTTTLYQFIITQYITQDRKIRMDGVIYPSVASELTGINIALKPKFVDENLKFFDATLYQLEKIDGNYMYLRCLREAGPNAVDDNGNITWSDARQAGKLFAFGPDTPTSSIPDYDIDEWERYYLRR